jgi:hypothetical protein
MRRRSGAVEGPRPASPPAALVVRSLKKAIGKPGMTAAAAGFGVGVVVGLVLVLALLATLRED